MKYAVECKSCSHHSRCPSFITLFHPALLFFHFLSLFFCFQSLLSTSGHSFPLPIAPLPPVVILFPPVVILLLPDVAILLPLIAVNLLLVVIDAWSNSGPAIQKLVTVVLVISLKLLSKTHTLWLDSEGRHSCSLYFCF